MAPPADAIRRGLTNLQKRILSAAVLLPLVAMAIIFGHPFFTLLIAVFAGAAAWEWTRIVAQEVRPRQPAAPVPLPPARVWLVPSIICIAVTVLTVVAAGFELGIDWVTVFGVGLILVIGSAAIAKTVVDDGPDYLSGFKFKVGRRYAMWFALGAAYATLPAAALVLIRNEPEWGRATLLWVVALVVVADTGAYIAGRSIGGPKLAPRISPNKTWAGLAGAVLGAGLVGLLTAFIVNHTNVWVLALLSAGLGVVEQGGDLVESAFKRHFGVKDTSQIIPGHGGVLDRVDGLLAVAVAVLVIAVWSGGSMLAWS